MRFIIFILRTALALVFLAYGINFFYHLTFVPVIPLDGKKAVPLVDLLTKTGYFFQMLYGIQIACGFFLLIDRFTPLFLAVAFPITVNIFLFHYFLDADNLSNLFLYGTILFVNILLLLNSRRAYRPLFYSRAQFVDREIEISYEVGLDDAEEPLEIKDEPEERQDPPEFRL
jgi:putative oxidoreductase